MRDVDRVRAEGLAAARAALNGPRQPAPASQSRPPARPAGAAERPPDEISDELSGELSGDGWVAAAEAEGAVRDELRRQQARLEAENDALRAEVTRLRAALGEVAARAAQLGAGPAPEPARHVPGRSPAS